MKAELEKAGITAGSGSFEQGDPNYRDDSLDAYAEFGVSYDKTSNHWMYGKKPIYILYDKERYTFCDKGVSDGVSLNVVRDKDGNIAPRSGLPPPRSSARLLLLFTLPVFRLTGVPPASAAQSSCTPRCPPRGRCHRTGLWGGAGRNGSPAPGCRRPKT